MTAADAMPQSEMSAQAAAGAPARPTRPLYWSVRRELWDNPSIWRAPLIAAAVVLAGIVIAAVHPPQIHTSGSGAHMSQADLRTLPYAIAAVAIGVISAIVSVFYCLGSLHNERRDRSILFWKSLPVSDLTTVVAKAIIPMAVLPVCVLATVLATHVLMMALNIATVAAHGQDIGLLLSQVPLLRLWLTAAWGLFAFALWWAPIYGWLFVISAWARRMTFLWAVAPPIALVAFERLAFETHYIGDLLSYRLNGSWTAAFEVVHPHPGTMGLSNPDPVRFFTTPGLWVGLVIAIALLALAIRLRRRADPI
jgi:ABC-2 type transport system permease protein